MKTLIFALASILMVASSAHAIVNGRQVPTEETSFFQMVPKLKISNPQALGTEPALCTGTLIAEDIVLTAAHCLDNHATDLHIELNFGETKIISNKYILHSGYTTQTSVITSGGKKQAVGGLRDIALILLPTKLPTFAKAHMPDFFNQVRTNTEVVIMGYGRYQEDFVSDEFLRRALTSASVMDENRLYLAGDSAICSGDSGGPAFLVKGDRYFVVGVTSNGDCNYISKHTNVMDFVSWIETAAAELRLRP